MPDRHPTSGSGSAAHAVRTDPSAAGAAELAQGAALAVLAVPAVTRLEPTLRNALQRLQASTNRWRPEAGTRSAATDGVMIHRRGEVVDVHVDLAVSPTRPAHRTASAVQDALRRYVIGQQLVPGTITVAVLTLEH